MSAIGSPKDIEGQSKFLSSIFMYSISSSSSTCPSFSVFSCPLNLCRNRFSFQMRTCRGQRGSSTFPIGGYGEPVTTLLDKIQQFAQQNSHEIFLLRLRNHHHISSQPTQQGAGACVVQVQQAIFDRLCENVNACPAVFSAAVGNSSPWPSLAEMLRRGIRYVVVSDGAPSHLYIRSNTVRLLIIQNLTLRQKF